MQQQHPLCQFEFEDFKKSKTVRCDFCFTLDSRVCLGGSHKRRGALQGNIVYLP